MPANEESHRKLAAILSADVVGYSRLMEADEQATVDRLKSSRAAIRGHIERHRGRVVNAPGDAVLAEFPSAVEAVQCAFEIQQDLQERNIALSPERRMHYRIGVNLGDVIQEADGTLYGDGVNIAARLEALAEAGGVCVSGSVHDAVEGKLDLGFDFLGEQQVKNLSKPIRVYRLRGQAPGGAPAARGRLRRRALLAGFVAAGSLILALAVGLAWRMLQAPAEDAVLALPRGPSIVVLPFANLSGDPKQDYFVDGLTEEIITALTRFRELFVIARNSSFKYKGQAVDVRQVGRELGVRYVVEGSVRTGGDTVRVTAQLLEAATGAHLWAATYDKPLSARNLLALQDEITEEVAGAIANVYGVISRTGISAGRARSTDNLDAYLCVLQAQQWWADMNPTDQAHARTCLENAVVADPDYASAWAWLSIVLRDEQVYGHVQRGQPASLERALDAARRAVALDPSDAMARFAVASVYYFAHDVERFRVEAEEALRLNPNNALILAEFSTYFGFMGEFDRSMALVRKAMRLNPHHPGWYHVTVFHYHYHRREYPEALVAAQKWDQPDFYWNQVHLAQAYAHLGRTAEARAAVAKVLELYPDFARNARKEYLVWNQPEEIIAHELEGLRKAGMEIPE